MKDVLLFCTMIISLALSSCKRESFSREPATSRYLAEGKWSSYFGKQLIYPIMDIHWRWGRNSSEIFSGNGNDLVRIDFSKDESEVVNGLISIQGQNQENTGMLFAAKIDGVEGQYLFNYANNKVERIQSFYYQNQLVLSKNTVAVFYSGVAPAPALGCMAPWDFWCNGFVPQEKILYLYTRNTPAPFAFPGRGLIGFTRDGSQAVLIRGDYGNMPMAFLYVNLQTGAITDSIPRLATVSYYVDQIIKSISLSNDGRLLTIYNASTGQLLKSFTFSNQAIVQRLQWSWDGTKVYFVAYEDSTKQQVIEIIDVDSEKQTRVAAFPLNFYIASLQLSNDNKRMLIQPGTINPPQNEHPFYIKDIVY